MSTKTENAARAKRWQELIDKDEECIGYINDSLDGADIRKGMLVRREELLEIDYSLKKAKENEHYPEISITSNNTYDEIVRLCDEVSTLKMCVLNFASYFNAGGGFLKGSIAQEESLCHVSALYNVLIQTGVYEERNSKKDVCPEYEDELIYTPEVPFTTVEGKLEELCLVDVISIAAPNCNRVPIARYDKYIKCLKKRIEAIFVLPYLNKCNKLILGAWGCGVFKNDPRLISQYFDEACVKYGQLYDEIVYSIPNDSIRKIFNNIIGERLGLHG